MSCPRRSRRPHLLALLLALVALWATPAAARPVREVTPIQVNGQELGTITFANLVLHAPEVDQILVASDKVVLSFLEEMRARGYRALGGESLAFGQDQSAKAEFVLGGTIKELAYSDEQGGAFGIGVDWELLHVASNRVIYRAMVRHEEIGVGKMEAQAAGNALFLGALRGLLARPKFVAALEARPDGAVAAGEPLPPGELRRCTSGPVEMPKQSDVALRATAVVRTSAGVGSGVVVSPDGVLLTAAHVVGDDSEVTVRFKDGQESKATVLRVDPASDAALLQLQKGQQDVACLEIDEAVPETGAEIYALGSPTGEVLAFSVSRGIVSGRRTIEDHSVIQTDASISPGNSGGPLVDAQGRVVAIVSFKVTGEGVEGLGFGVPAATALQALSIQLGENTSALLAPRSASGGSALTLVVDDADPPFYYVGKEAKGKTPGWVRPVRGWGFAIGLSGLATALTTGLMKRDPGNFDTLRTWNTVGWGVAFLGTGMVLSSYVFNPRRRPEAAPAPPPTGAPPGGGPPAPAPGPAARIDVGVPGIGPAALSFSVTF